MLLTEKYKNRLKELAGIFIKEDVDTEARAKLYAKSGERVPFNREMMRQAILNGQEIGLSFQSNNVRYKMPVTKFRIVQPVAMGTDKNGNFVIRGLHVMGQSEEKAIQTGVRSAEAHNEWRLFKASNIKAMWFTGRYFHGPMPGYNPHDKAMLTISAAIDFGKAKAYQDKISSELTASKQKSADEKKKLIRPLFKKDYEDTSKPPSEEPLKKPASNTSAKVS
jgi:hypothetical protein